MRTLTLKLLHTIFQFNALTIEKNKQKTDFFYFTTIAKKNLLY